MVSASPKPHSPCVWNRFLHLHFAHFPVSLKLDLSWLPTLTINNVVSFDNPS